MKEEKFNVEICASTNLPCCKCQPVCSHRLICDKCEVETCLANFDGWCRQKYLECWLRKSSSEYAEVYRKRKGE